MLGKAPFASLVPVFPLDFALALRDLCGVHTFVETGTYHGDTTRLVAPHFERVITVEGVRERWEAVRDQVPDNVTCLYGGSETTLAQALGLAGGPALIFLDAHWIYSGMPIDEDGYQQPVSVCPVLEELDQIDMAVPHVILIDDLIYFDSPPQNRGELVRWPSLDQLVAHMPGRYVFTRHGMLCAVPDAHRAAVREWLFEHFQSHARYYKPQEQYEP